LPSIYIWVKARDERIRPRQVKCWLAQFVSRVFLREIWRYPGPGIRAWNSRSELLAGRSGRADSGPWRVMESGSEGERPGQPLSSAKARNDRHDSAPLRGITAPCIAKAMASFRRAGPPIT